MNFKKFIIAVLIASAFVTTSFAYAQDVQKPEFNEENLAVIGESDVVNHDVFNFADTVEIKGTINGDVYTAGGDVVVRGTVNGDVLAAGGSVQLAPGSVVAQDVRVAGGKITVDGKVDGNITAAGGTLLIGNQAEVAGSLTGAGNDIRINAPIGKNLKLAGKSIYLNGPITGGADITTQSMTFGDNGRIQGDLSYMSENEFMINEGKVSGTIQHKLPPQELQKPENERREHVVGRAFAFVGILGVIARLFLGLLFIHIVPEFSKKAADKSIKQIWRSLGTGFLIVVLAPVLIFALLTTVIGIPIALMCLAGYVILMYFSSIVVMLGVGQIIAKRLNKKWNEGLMFAVGLLVFFVIRFIPVVNIILSVFVMLVGVGAIANTKVEVYKELRKKNLI